MNPQLSLLFFVLVIVSPLTLAQLCYVTVTSAAGSTKCKGPPYHTLSEVISDPICNFTVCQQLRSNGVLGESYSAYLRNPDAIPQPTNFIELMYYSDSACTALRKIEYFENAPCTTASGNFF